MNLQNSDGAGRGPIPANAATDIINSPGPARLSGTDQPTEGHRQRRDRLVASAVRHRRSGRAQYDRDIVPRCPLCAFPHWHVAFESATSYERSPSCRPSATYTVNIIRVVPDAVPLPAQRIEGAA